MAAAMALRMRWACAAECVADSLEGAVCTAPLDFVLLVDNSGSLADFVDSVDNFMVEFINSFALSSAGPMISLILFNTEAETTVLRGLSHDKDDLLASIANERPAPDGSTSMRAGLNKAEEVLDASERLGYASRVILLLSDGLSSSPNFSECIGSKETTCELARLVRRDTTPCP